MAKPSSTDFKTSTKTSAPSQFKILIDADACPVSLKEILFRAAKRLNVRLILVANARQRIPSSDLISLVLVPAGADKADQKIVELLRGGDLVITADVPLAAAVVEKGGTALGTRGELFDRDSVGERLAVRDLMDQARSAGVETRGPKPLNNKDVQLFANHLDRILVKMMK